MDTHESVFDTVTRVMHTHRHSDSGLRAQGLRCDWRSARTEMGMLMPNNQRQHRSLHIQKDVLPNALC